MKLERLYQPKSLNPQSIHEFVFLSSVLFCSLSRRQHEGKQRVRTEEFPCVELFFSANSCVHSLLFSIKSKNNLMPPQTPCRRRADEVRRAATERPLSRSRDKMNGSRSIRSCRFGETTVRLGPTRISPCTGDRSQATATTSHVVAGRQAGPQPRSTYWHRWPLRSRARPGHCQAAPPPAPRLKQHWHGCQLLNGLQRGGDSDHGDHRTEPGRPMGKLGEESVSI